MNRLYFGDCLTIMEEMPLGSVDLIYLDPPFNSQRDYNAIYKDETGRPLPAQIEAFGDMWTLNEERERELRAMPVLMREAGIADESVEFWRLWMNALRRTNPNLLAYLSYMTQRLLPMRGLLKPTGSIYLHCDSTASHYIKVMMDAIFGHEGFRREIIWNLQTASGYKSKASNYIRGHDVILYYTKSRKYTFNKSFLPHKPEYTTRFKKVDQNGRKYRDDRPGKRRQYFDETPGVALTDVWSDIMSFQQNSTSNERLGYATQKPLALLKRIIKASSNEGDVVFDPFCGCATTLEAAHSLNRKWVGIDIAIHAIKRVAAMRLRDRLALKEGVDFEIDGIPRDLEGVHDLWTRDKYHFQRWAVEQVDGFVTTKRTADGGIDGRLYFSLPNSKDLSSMAIEVKGGKNVGIKEARELRGVLDNDDALMAGLIILDSLGPMKERNIRRFMAEAGDLDVMGVKYARMQLLTVAEILENKRFHTPGVAGRGLAQPNLI